MYSENFTGIPLPRTIASVTRTIQSLQTIFHPFEFILETRRKLLLCNDSRATLLTCQLLFGPYRWIRLLSRYYTVSAFKRRIYPSMLIDSRRFTRSHVHADFEVLTLPFIFVSLVPLDTQVEMLFTNPGALNCGAPTHAKVPYTPAPSLPISPLSLL
jgi:hypothetical protein